MADVLITILAAVLAVVCALLTAILNRDGRWHEEVRQDFIETRKNFQTQFDCLKALLARKVDHSELEKFCVDNNNAHNDLWKRLYGHYHNDEGDVTVPKERS